MCVCVFYVGLSEWNAESEEKRWVEAALTGVAFPCVECDHRP